MRGIFHVGAVVALLTVLSGTGFAAIETYEFASPKEESRYQKMIAELRCLVCQNQNLADSNAELARDLRAKTYEMIKAGSSDSEIADFMVARYGDFVLYKPPLKARTLLLWVGPFAILLIALIVYAMTIRKSRAGVAVSSEERARAAKFLDQDQ